MLPANPKDPKIVIKLSAKRNVWKIKENLFEKLKTSGNQKIAFIFEEEVCLRNDTHKTWLLTLIIEMKEVTKKNHQGNNSCDCGYGELDFNFLIQKSC